MKNVDIVPILAFLLSRQIQVKFKEIFARKLLEGQLSTLNRKPNRNSTGVILRNKGKANKNRFVLFNMFY